MLIDKTHRGWLLGTLACLGLASGLYWAYAVRWPGGPSGRTWPGILFGLGGTSLMAFAGALAIRKKSIAVRAGSLSWWLKGHIWLGTLSVPLILFHAAFRAGGQLEIVLWVLLAIVIASGFVGLALQNFIPRMMKLQLSSESIPDQIDEACRRLVASADEQVTSCCTPDVVAAAISADRSQSTAASQPLRLLADFYIHTLRPYLAPGKSNNLGFANAEQAQGMFERLRSSLPEACLAVVDHLEDSCTTRRQLSKQQQLFWWLHTWLKVHVPASTALGIFTVIHVISALYY
jgi:hypothetical protein